MTEARGDDLPAPTEPPAPPAPPGPTPSTALPADTKAARTRAAIIDAALRLFRERGFEATTMRAVAAEAGVSVGNAYYYFASKEELIQGFYDRAQLEHEAAARSVLDSTTDLAARIVGVVDAWVGAMEPYRPFAGKFFKHAAEPTSPLSPFSPQSSPARVAAIDLWREVLDGADVKVPKRLRDELPELLWLYFMGLVLFWVHDPSDDTTATRRIAAASAPLVVRAIGMSRLPVVRGMLDDVRALIAEVKQVFAIADAPAANGTPPDQNRSQTEGRSEGRSEDPSSDWDDREQRP
jgi:AcrR family transcriptional regulator